ncbi:MAG: cation diffusion facilitator family transporter, partial [Acidimicrobiia bacterium]|nr:cation diffusion facilitator family transporter [Acidimicrobiia bacterium]
MASTEHHGSAPPATAGPSAAGRRSEMERHSHDHPHGRGHDHSGGHDHPDGHRHDSSHGHGHGHGHEHGSGSLWSGFKHGVSELLGTHSHDHAESIDSAIESSKRGVRALVISFTGLMVTAVLQ